MDRKVDMSHGYMPLDEDCLTPINYKQSLQQSDDLPQIYHEDDKIAPPSMGLRDEDEPEMQMPLLSTPPTPALNGLNYLNFVTYLAHLFVSYGIGVWGLDGILLNRWQISQQYETLVTPAKGAYAVWLPILVFEAVFAIAQLLPEFRSRPIIQDGTGFFFFYTCLVQTAWTMFFAFRFFIVSFVTVVAALVSLAFLLVSQHYSQTRGQHSPAEYWLFRFPFFLHCGWMVVMTAVHFSLLFRYESPSNLGTQLAANILSLAMPLPVAFYFLTTRNNSTTRPDFEIPAVILWAYIGIAWRLRNPSQELQEDFGEVIISAIQISARVLAISISCLLLPRVLLWTCHSFFTIHVVQLDDSYGETMSV